MPNKETNTTHLCFVYIGKYKCLNDVSICLDDRYEFKFDSYENVLTIRKNEKHIEHLWGKGIYSLSAIVGENGAGKSTAISHMLESVVDGYPDGNSDGIYVVEEENKKLIAYTRMDIRFDYNGLDVSVSQLNRKFSIETFYFSSHFSVSSNSGNITSNQLSGMYNGSDYCRLVRDYQDFCNVHAMNLNNTIQHHIVGYNSQNTYRIVLLLSQAYGDMNKFGLNPPKYVKIIPNISGRYALYTKPSANYKRYWTKVPSIYPPTNHHPNGKLNPKRRCLYEFAYHIALNLATNDSKLNYKFIKFLIAWTNVYNDGSLTTDNFYNKLQECFKKQKGVRVDEDTIGTITNLIHLLEENCDINEYGEFYIDIEEKGGNLLTLINFSRSNRLFVTARFFDMVYAHNVNDTTTLSSGELEMLNLYSRIYDAVVSRPSIASNIKSPNLILLDEAEIGYHPEWQRKFVKNIVTFLNALGKGEEFFQVVMTSHSPIILSDIPRSCTNYLTRGKPIPTEETFGANIFDLYRNSFFLGDGLIGEYALDKISRLEKEIKETISNIENGNFNSNSRDFVVNANKIIQSIGDDRIREYLLDMLSEIDPQRVIEYYEMKIDNLKNKYNHEQD